MTAQTVCRDTIDFTGITVPVFTPMKKNGDVATWVIEPYAKYLKRHNIMRILVNGTTGEGPLLTLSERQKVVEAWAEAVKDTNQKLMIQVGGAPLRDVIQLVKHARRVKAESILCLPDLYFKPRNASELVEYMEVIDRAANDIPLFYYHIPMLTNVNICMEEFLELAKSSNLKNFKGIKFTSTNLEEAARALAVGDGRYTIFLGCDQLLAPARLMGITSFIVTTVNFAPYEVQRIIDTVAQDGKIDEKSEPMVLQRKLCNFIRNVTKAGSWVECMKIAMNCSQFMSYAKDLGVGDVRLPLRVLPAQERQNILNEVRMAQFKQEPLETL